MVAEAKRADAVWYPESDNMGEHELQRFIAELLRPLIERWLGAQGRVAHAGADQFFYWVQGDPARCRAPDVYVIEGVAQDIPEVGVWKVWEGHRPTLALEVCSDDWQKDYDQTPSDYEAMGAREVLVYDPGATPRSRRRVRWQVLRRVEGRGLIRVLSTREDGVYSEVLGCWVREVLERGHLRLRLGEGPRGEDLFPTEAEAAHERERASLEREQAAHERERASLERASAALEEVERLKALVEALSQRTR